MCDQKSIYVHIPFCVKKCGYCDFYSVTDLSIIPDYIKSLQKEIETRSDSKDKINTIYFGGGTPSLIPVKEVENLIETITEKFSVSNDIEITLEVNPGTIDLNYLRQLKSIGINRLSIGVQSFNDEKLKFLGRIHRADQAEKILNNAISAGFTNISLDMIYGLSFETKKIWLNDLKKAASMMPPHISCYMLTIEPGTPFGEKQKKSLISSLDSDVMTRLFKLTSQVLAEYGFEHYEISNFAKDRKSRAKHNSKYWEMTPYYGFGASAHSYNGKSRYWNYKNIESYIKEIGSGKLPVQGREALTRKQKMLEKVMLRLRTMEGLDINEFEKKFQVSFKQQYNEILEPIQKNLLGSIKEGMFALNLEGKTHINSIVEAFAKIIL